MIKNYIEQFVKFLLKQESVQIKKRAKKVYDYKTVLEINKKVLSSDYNFDYLYNLTNSSDLLVKEVASSYFVYKFAPKLMTHLYHKFTDKSMNDVKKFIQKGLSLELKNKICSHLKVDKEFLALIKKDNIYTAGLGSKVKEVQYYKKIMKKDLKKTILNSKEKIAFISSYFGTSAVPEYIGYIFDEEIKNDILDFMILNIRKKEVFGKKYNSEKQKNGDLIISKLVDKRFFELFNKYHNCGTIYSTLLN